MIVRWAWYQAASRRQARGVLAISALISVWMSRLARRPFLVGGVRGAVT